MWAPVIEKMQSKNDRERLKRLENDVRAQKKAIAGLEERIEELEKKENDKQQKQKTHHYYLSTSGGNGVFIE